MLEFCIEKHVHTVILEKISQTEGYVSTKPIVTHYGHIQRTTQYTPFDIVDIYEMAR